MPKIDVLDHGFVEFLGALGDDLTVVNAARVSFGKRKTELDESDKKLIRYLAKNQHWSPFRHVQLQFHIKMPEFAARQTYKHVVGIAYSEGGAREVDHAWNEISQRYVDGTKEETKLEFYLPTEFRKQSASNKQASTDERFDPVLEEYGPPINDNVWGSQALKTHTNRAYCLYEDLLEAGVAREQARMVLPLNVYTEFYWTASLQAVVNFIKLRKHTHAQWEIQQYAIALEQLARQVCPVAVEALLGGEAK